MRRAVVAILVLLACSVSSASAGLGMTMATTVTALSTVPIAYEVFYLPAGYTKR